MNRTTTPAEERAEDAVRARWETDAGLRAEFGNNLEACVAFHRAEARGATRTVGGGVVRISGRPQS